MKYADANADGKVSFDEIFKVVLRQGGYDFLDSNRLITALQKFLDEINIVFIVCCTIST